MNYFLRRQEMALEHCDGILHEIKKKDTLYNLSRFYKVSLEDILEKNPTVDVYNLKIGDKLCIPMKYKTYTIKKGETLDEFLERFNIKYEEFKKINPQMKPFEMNENEVVFLPEYMRI